MQRTEEGISLHSRGTQVPKLLRTNDPVSSTNKLKGRHRVPLLLAFLVRQLARLLIEELCLAKKVITRLLIKEFQRGLKKHPPFYIFAFLFFS